MLRFEISFFLGAKERQYCHIARMPTLLFDHRPLSHSCNSSPVESSGDDLSAKGVIR